MRIVELKSKEFTQRDLGVLSVYVVQTLKYRSIPERWPLVAIDETLKLLREIGCRVPACGMHPADARHNLLQFLIAERKAGNIPPVLRGSKNVAMLESGQGLLFGDMYDLESDNQMEEET
jgi:hypothetical protein